MKYVCLGNLDTGAITAKDRVNKAKAKLAELGIKVESIYYTQGNYDFVDVFDAPNAEAMLAFSLWYAKQGYGRLQSMPAFDARAMDKALATARARPRQANKKTTRSRK